MNLETVESLAKRKYSEIGDSHGWEHIQRVKKNAQIIGKKESADLEIVLPAAVLHDLGRASGKEENHAQDTELAEEILTQAKCDVDVAEKILECIKTHSYGGKEKPKLLEAKVLFDSDKIDSYGFVGVARFFMLGGEEHLSVSEAIENAFDRITTLGKVGGFLTKAGKELGFKKAKHSIVFYYLLMAEVGDAEKLGTIENLVKEKFGEQTLNELKMVADKI